MKKRLRGFRRHLRQHQQRATATAALDIVSMQGQQYAYEKLGLAPWHVNSKPPLAIRKLWLGNLIAHFRHWQGQLRKQYSDFYLAVWLFEPAFGESQLVAGIGERKTGYETAFGDELAVSLPCEYQAVPGVEGLHWTARKHIITCSPADFVAMGAWAYRKPHWPIEMPTGKAGVAVQVGLVWIGQDS